MLGGVKLCSGSTPFRLRFGRVGQCSGNCWLQLPLYDSRHLLYLV